MVEMNEYKAPLLSEILDKDESSDKNQNPFDYSLQDIQSTEDESTPMTFSPS